MIDMRYRYAGALSVCLAMMLMVLSGCDFSSPQSYDASEYTNVYMPQAQGGAVQWEAPIVDTLQSRSYNAAFAGAELPGKDIPVRFSVEPDSVESFNEDNLTDHQLLPAASYTLTETEDTIRAGERASNLSKINLATEGFLEVRGTSYLLPIRMEVLNESVRINEDKQVAYFVIQGSFLDFDKSDWEIVDFSSQMPDRSDKAAVLAIDGDPNTHWHTPWCCAADEYGTSRPQPPHTITIDVGEVKSFHGLEIVGRDDNWGNNPKEVTVKFSNSYEGDDTNWRDAEDFTTPLDANGNEIRTKIYLENAVDARYFKFITREPVDNDLLNLAELGAF